MEKQGYGIGVYGIFSKSIRVILACLDNLVGCFFYLFTSFELALIYFTKDCLILVNYLDGIINLFSQLDYLLVKNDVGY